MGKKSRRAGRVVDLPIHKRGAPEGRRRVEWYCGLADDPNLRCPGWPGFREWAKQACDDDGRAAAALDRELGSPNDLPVIISIRQDLDSAEAAALLRKVADYIERLPEVLRSEYWPLDIGQDPPQA